MKKKILTTITLIMFCTLAFCQCVKAETEVKTTIQMKKGATAWTTIRVTDAYDKCQELNEDNSALGTTSDNVMAHLSTNADWFAVTLLKISAYGTTNSSGISGPTSYSYTAGILENYADKDNYRSLIENKDSKFVEIINKVRDNNQPGLGFLTSEVLPGSTTYFSANKDYPISVRAGWSGFYVGSIDGRQSCNGVGYSYVSFRPAIWVK